jgi:hypothetical protein
VPTEASTVSAYAKSACGVSGVMNSPNTVTVANLSRSGQSADFTFKTQARNGGTLYTVSADAKVFDANCKPLDHSIIKDGDSVLAFVKADPSRSTYVTGESLAVGALIVQTP